MKCGHVSKLMGMAVLGCMATGLATCGKTHNSYNYQLIISVRDHGELRMVSSVVGVRESSSPTGAANRPQVCGEAMVIPLQSGRFIFVLLEGGQVEPQKGRARWLAAPTQVLLHRLGLPGNWASGDDTGIRKLGDIRQSFQLLPYEWPEIVTFKNAKDPRTILRVDPENESATLGEGVEIERLTLQVTNDAITRGQLKSVLPWFDSSKEHLDGSRFGYDVKRYHSYKFARCD